MSKESNIEMLVNAMREAIKQDPDFLKKLTEELKKEEAGDLIMKAVEEQNDDEYPATKYHFTDNGAMVLKSSGKKFVDLNFALSSFRGATGAELQGLIDKFSECRKENPLLAWKYMFYVGDVREGAGERKAFLEMFKYMMKYEDPTITTHMIRHVPEYTRFDMLFKIWEAAKELSTESDFEHLKNFFTPIAAVVSEQFAKDWDYMQAGKPISLLAKWMPSVNTSSKRTRTLAFDVMKMVSLDPKNSVHQELYRKSLSKMRKYLNVVEVSMSSNDWEKINYENIPSKAALKYKDAYRKHDSDRYDNYLSKAVEGKAKFNASVTQPHEIISKIRNGNYYYDKDNALIAAWNNLKDMVINDNTVVVCDTSGSMRTNVGGANRIEAVDVSIGLAIYCSERLVGSMKDKFITFSEKPSFVDLSAYNDIYEKVRNIKTINSNTNIEAVFRLLAKAYAAGEVNEVEMPSKILIISDMQFDAARMEWGDRYNSVPRETLFENINKEWRAITNGKVQIPKLIFWNVCDRDKDTIPMSENENGLILLSGFSTNLLKMAMSGEYDPFAALLEVLSGHRYDLIDNEYNYASYLGPCCFNLK